MYKKVNSDNWKSIGLTYNFMDNPYQPNRVITTDKGTILAVGKYNLYRRDRIDYSWRNVSLEFGVLGSLGNYLAEIPGYGIYMASNGLYLSKDDGLHWTEMAQSDYGLPVFSSNGLLYSFQKRFYDIVVSSDSGRTWNSAIYHLKNFSIFDMTVGLGDTLFVTGSGADSSYTGASIYKVASLDSAGWHLSLFEDSGDFNDNFGSVVSNKNGQLFTLRSNGSIFRYNYTTGKWSKILALNIPTNRDYYDVYYPSLQLDKQNHLVASVTIYSHSSLNNTSTTYYRSSKSVIDMQPLAVETAPKIPVHIQLGHNYPNPFNPTTVIPFTLEKTGVVNLAVYNILGQRVAILLNEKVSSGRHVVTFNAGHLASGLYFYRLEVQGQVLSRKMILIK